MRTTSLGFLFLFLFPACHSPEEPRAAEPPIERHDTFGPGLVRADPPAAAAPKPAAGTGIDFPGTDLIVVTCAPQANFAAEDVRTVRITDAEAIAAWLAALAKVPPKGTRLIKFVHDAPEHRLEFFRGTELLGTLRMKGGQLDAPAAPSWDFYSGEDREFTALVAARF